MEAFILRTNNKEKLEKALTYLKKLGISYQKIKSKESRAIFSDEEFSDQTLNEIARHGEGLDFLYNEDELYTDEDLKIKY